MDQHHTIQKPLRQECLEHLYSWQNGLKQPHLSTFGKGINFPPYEANENSTPVEIPPEPYLFSVRKRTVNKKDQCHYKDLDFLDPLGDRKWK